MSKHYKVDDVSRAIIELPDAENGYSDSYDKAEILNALEDIPTIEVSENAPSVVPSRAEGEWINKQEKYQMAECSNCKKVTMHEMWGDKLVYYDYCPNCGAKMKGAE